MGVFVREVAARRIILAGERKSTEHLSRGAGDRIPTALPDELNAKPARVDRGAALFVRGASRQV